MFSRSFKILFVLLLLAIPSQGMAQSKDAAYLGYLNLLNKLNNYSPAKSPRHELIEEILTDRVTDSKNEVIGEVLDVVLDSDGSIAMMSVEFDRLKLGTDKLTLDTNVMQIQPTGNGYKLGYTKQQIVDMFPTLLADISTASGQDGLISTSQIKGVEVWTPDDRKIGKVENVLFNQLGGKAELLFVNMGGTMLDPHNVAIPFNAAGYEFQAGQIKVIVPEQLAAAMKEVSKK